MGRRSLISASAVQQMFSTYRRQKKEAERYALIEKHQSYEKEKPVKIILQNVDFDLITRVTKLEFVQIQEYRTIQKYITQNYVKYPIYSEWKIKRKTINKTLKLTNSELEFLNAHKDELVRRFAEEIIVRINNEDLYPSWFVKSFLQKEYNLKL